MTKKKTIIATILISLLTLLLPIFFIQTNANANENVLDNKNQVSYLESDVVNPGQGTVSNIGPNSSTLDVVNFENGTGDSKANRVRINLTGGASILPFEENLPDENPITTFSMDMIGLAINTTYSIEIVYLKDDVAITTVSDFASFTTLPTTDPFAYDIKLDTISKTNAVISFEVKNWTDEIKDDIYLRIRRVDGENSFHIVSDYKKINKTWLENTRNTIEIVGLRPSQSYEVDLIISEDGITFEKYENKFSFKTNQLATDEAIVNVGQKEIVFNSETNNWQIGTTKIGDGTINTIQYSIDQTNWIDIANPTFDEKNVSFSFTLDLNGETFLNVSEKILFRVNQNNDLISDVDEQKSLIPLEENNQSSRTWLIVGIVIASVGILSIIGSIVYTVLTRKKEKSVL